MLPPVRATRGKVDVLVVGRYFCDLVFSGLPRLPEAGEELFSEGGAIVPGGAYNTVVALHRLGVATAWACTFGTDPFSKYVIENSEIEGLRSDAFEHVSRPLSNISASLSMGTERSFVSYAEPIVESVSTPRVVELISSLRPRVVLLPGLPKTSMDAVASAAGLVGALLFVDPQSTSTSTEDPKTRRQLSLIDIFAPNEREIRKLTGRDDVESAVRFLAPMTGLLLVKSGAKGALAADLSGEVWVEATPADPVETTGAGDCFNAGFVMALLAGDTVEGCVQAGNAAGALSTLAPGSEGAPTRAMLERARDYYH